MLAKSQIASSVIEPSTLPLFITECTKQPSELCAPIQNVNLSVVLCVDPDEACVTRDEITPTTRVVWLLDCSCHMDPPDWHYVFLVTCNEVVCHGLGYGTAQKNWQLK